MTEYLNDFVQESEESITELNNALLDLERNPDDGSAMDQVFRTAHTLKGNAGAMGFDDASDLAHALEDLLDAIRAGSLEISPELMDEVFDAVDTLELLLEEIAEYGETRTDPIDRIDALRDRIEETTGLTKPSDRQLVQTLSGGDRPKRRHDVYHASLSISDDPESGKNVLNGLDDAFDLLSTDPEQAAIRGGDHDGIVDVAFGSVVDEAAIAAALEPVANVEEAIITEVPDPILAEALDEDAVAEEPAEVAGVEADDVDPQDMSVDDLLDEFTEYDDLDEAVDRVDDVQGLENMGEAGAFSDIVEEDVTTAPEETAVGDEATSESAVETTDADDGSEEVEDVQGTFEDLQDEYDRVGLDEMESELEDVSFGEFDEEDEVGFDELLGDEFEPVQMADESETAAAADAEPAEAESTESEPAEVVSSAPAITDPDEDAVEAAVNSAAAPSDPDRGVFLVRLSVVEGSGVNNGIRVVEALRDAFDLLGTVPTETAIGEEDYDGSFDAVFGSDVGEDQIRAALDPVEEVAQAIIVEVTERMPEPPTPDPAEESAADADPTEAGGAAADADVDELVPEEPDDAQAAFATLQEEYDQVGLDEMESELEGVSFGEYDEEDEVGFDELLGDEVEEAVEEPEPEPTAPAIDAPDEAAIEAAVNAAATPSDPDRGVFLVRSSVVEESGVNNGIRVVEALRDAFDLLGTVPTETAIGEDDYDGSFDAVFGSDVGEDQIRAALDSVEEVGEAIVVEVTERMPEPPTPDPVEESATDVDATAEADGAETDADVDELVPEEPDDAQAAFATLQEEYDQVGLDEMESELEGVSFGEYDEEDEVGFDELIGDEIEEREPADATAADEVEAGASDVDAGEADASFDESGEVEAGFDESGDEFGEAETGFDESGDEFGEVEAGGADFEDPDEFGEVEAGGTDFDDPDEFADASADEDFADAGSDFGEEDVTVDEISVDDEDEFGELDVDVDEVEAGDADDFGEAETDEFGAVDVDAGSDFGEVESMDPGQDVTENVAEEATADVDTIRGIGESYTGALDDAGVETVADFVVQDAGDLAAETGISQGRIEEWMDRAPVSASQAEEYAEVEAESETADAEAEAPSSGREIDEIQSIRVDVDRIEDLMGLVEEMVTSRARLRRAIEEDASRDVLEDELDELEVSSSQLQDQVMEMRLVPVQTVTQRLPRVVRDIARDQGKRVRFETEGEDVEVDRSILNQIGDPLIHLVRNAVDHGIESPDEREIAGKDPEGTVLLRAQRTRDIVEIEIEDDGAGLDADVLREEAIEEGVVSREEADRLSDADAYDLIFRSGFSTREEVTDVSGRGVGMDVVANTVEELDGEVTIDSTSGEGTTVRMTLPVSVAISEVLFLEIGGEEYGLPIKVVDEISAMGMAQTVQQNGHVAIETEDGRTKDLVRLNEVLSTPDPHRSRGGGMLVTIEDDVRPIAIQCDEVRGQQEVVIKPFEGILSGIPGLSGAAVLGEGDVINIIDVETL